jgi:hypothetical protein
MRNYKFDTIVLKPYPGTDIDDMKRDARRIAELYSCTVKFVFNDVGHEIKKEWVDSQKRYVFITTETESVKTGNGFM